MLRKWFLVLVVIVCLAAVWFVRLRRSEIHAVSATDGISQALAVDRAKKISALRYDLTLSVPERKQEPVRGRVIVRFDLADRTNPLQLDFAQPADRVSSIKAGGAIVPIDSQHGHLVVPPHTLRRGANEIAIDFVAGDQPLNRNDDYLYSLFVPARASQAFPCFDQPDLKGSIALSKSILKRSDSGRSRPNLPWVRKVISACVSKCWRK